MNKLQDRATRLAFASYLDYMETGQDKPDFKHWIDQAKNVLSRETLKMKPAAFAVKFAFRPL